MKKIILDTNIIIDYVKGKDKLLNKLLKLQDQKKAELMVSTIVVFEFYSGTSLNKKSVFEKTEHLFSRFKIFEIDEKIAKLAAKINRKYKLYEKIGSEDLLIGATALYYSAYLATKNIKHFKLIPGLKILNSIPTSAQN